MALLLNVIYQRTIPHQIGEYAQHTFTHALDWIMVQGDDNRLLMAQGIKYLLNICFPPRAHTRFACLPAIVVATHRHF